MGRIGHGSDLLEALTDLCKQHGIRAGSVETIGALKKTVLGYYYQDRLEYKVTKSWGYCCRNGRVAR